MGMKKSPVFLHGAIWSYPQITEPREQCSKDPGWLGYVG